MRYIEQSHRFSEEVANGYAFLKQLTRAGLCGLFFAVPLVAAIPISPLMRLSVTKNNQKAVMSRMIIDFFSLNFVAAALSYASFVETRLDKRIYGNGILPVLGPLSAQCPGMVCLCASHLFYPGAWAIINETTWKARRQMFVRLNVKCFLAFSPYHIPAAIAISAVIGTVLYPFKALKRSRFQRLDPKEG